MQICKFLQVSANSRIKSTRNSEALAFKKNRYPQHRGTIVNFIQTYLCARIAMSSLFIVSACLLAWSEGRTFTNISMGVSSALMSCHKHDCSKVDHVNEVSKKTTCRKNEMYMFICSKKSILSFHEQLLTAVHLKEFLSIRVTMWHALDRSRLLVRLQ